MGKIHNQPSMDSTVGNAKSLIEGHHQFLLRNTGQTNDPKVQHYVLNDEGILSNNRHFIADTYMEYQPNGDATTEGQSLLIIGFCYAYMATKNQKYLDLAIKYFDSYVSYFYAGQGIPDTPRRWICNWLCNGKEPTLAHYPLDYAFPTHSGFKTVELNYVNGVTQVPHGAPYFGEYIDVAYKAYDGALGWDSMVATVYGLLPDGSTDWDNMGVEYPVDWVVVRTGDKIDWDGNVISHNPTEPIGTIKLQNTTVNGLHKTTFAPKVPVELGGYMLQRNEVWHNRPAHVPLPGSANQMGNAADAELWFYEVCYLLFNITGEQRFKKAMDATLFTSMEYSDIDAADMFFRQSTAANTPWTDGIAYDYSYPNGMYRIYNRDQAGYIDIKAADGTLDIEQQAIAYKVDANKAICEINTGAYGEQGKPVSVTAKLQMSANKTDPAPDTYVYGFADFYNIAPVKYLIPINKFVKLLPDTRLADMRRFTDYGDIAYGMVFYSNVIDGRDMGAVHCTYGAGAAELTLGFWIDTPETSDITSVTYKSSEAFNLRIEDNDGWRWYWLLPAQADFVTLALPRSSMILSSYQPNHPDTDPRPTSPNWMTVAQCGFLRDNDTAGTATLDVYCLNSLPTRFAGNDFYTIKFTLEAKCDAYFSWKVGNCKINNYDLDSLNYTPGVIPFSNIYTEGSPALDGWHGLPYPGYQSPLIYTHEADTTRMNNMIDFMYDSQVAYTAKFGITGPGMSAYIWDRWDAVKYGPPNTWTMYHWGDGHAWDGYQPRAYYWAVRALYELVKTGKTPNPKLVTYVNNWTTWLVGYYDQYQMTPTNFPSESVPVPLPNDFTGHMCGLWLGGACLSAMSGYKPAGIERLIEGAFKELIDNYAVTTPDQVMNGAWSPGLRLGTDNGMFFGFWAGEILKGLGLYIMYKEGADFDWF